MMSETLTPIQIPALPACSRWRLLGGTEAGLYFAFNLRGFFSRHMLPWTLSQNYFTRTICYEKGVMESGREEVAPYHWVIYCKHN